LTLRPWSILRSAPEISSAVSFYPNQRAQSGFSVRLAGRLYIREKSLIRFFGTSVPPGGSAPKHPVFAWCRFQRYPKTG